MAQGLESPPPGWETWIELLAPGFGLTQPWLLQMLDELITHGISVSHSLP